MIVSASSAAVALAFDAGGTERQEDIWVGDLTEEEAKEFLALHGHEKNWKDFVDACVSAQYNNMLGLVKRRASDGRKANMLID